MREHINAIRRMLAIYPFELRKVTVEIHPKKGVVIEAWYSLYGDVRSLVPYRQARLAARTWAVQ